jgi:general secretion pathway protein D
MIKPPLANSIATLLATAVVAQPVLTTMAYGQSGSSAVARELARRQEYALRGEQALQNAKRAMHDKDYETAVSQYKLACDIIPNSTMSHALYAEALDGFCKASCLFAEQRIAEGRYVDAQTQLKVVLDERYNPRCRRAVVLLSHLETPGYYNQTIGPKFRGKVEEVKQLLLESEGYYDSWPVRPGRQAMRAGPQPGPLQYRRA